MTPRALLIGAPGAGKTTIGKALAVRLGLPFCDTDQEIERVAGTSIANIFVDEGEEAFRAYETQALRDVLTTFDGIVSLGGGVVMRAENRELLAGHTVVWLQVSLADAVKRIGLGTTRPLLMGNVRGRLMELMAERAPIYEAAATVAVQTSGRTVPAVVDELAETLGEHHA